MALVMDILRPLMRDPERKEPRIGGSLAAAICKVSTYGTRFSAYLELVEGYRPLPSKRMRLGKELELPIYRLAAEELQWASSQWIGDAPISHPTREWQRFSPDVVFDDGSAIADIKLSGYAAGQHGVPGTDDIGRYEMIQAHCYMEALISLGLPIKSGKLAVFDASRLAIVPYTVPYEPDLGALIVEECARFWRDHIVPKKPPPMDGSDAVRGWLEARHPTAQGERRPATPAEELLALEVIRKRHAVKAIEAEIDTLENRLRDSIGDAPGLNFADGSATWTNVQATEVAFTRKAYRLFKVNEKRRKK